MTDLAFYLYLVDVISNIPIALIVFLIIAIFLIFFGLIHWEHEGNSKIFKIGAIIAVINILILVLIPSKKTMYMMMAVETGNKIVQQPEIKELLNKTLTIINHKLDELDGKGK